MCVCPCMAVCVVCACVIVRVCVRVCGCGYVFVCGSYLTQQDKLIYYLLLRSVVRINLLWYKQYRAVCGCNSSRGLCKSYRCHSAQQCSSSVCSLPDQCKHTMRILATHFCLANTSEWNLHSCFGGSNMERNIISSEPAKFITVRYESAS